MAPNDDPNTLLDIIAKWINNTFPHKLVSKDLLQKFCSDTSNPIRIPCNSFQDVLDLIDKNNSWDVLPFILEQDWNQIKFMSYDYKLKLIEQLRLKPLYNFHIFYTIIRWGDCELLDLLITDYKLDDYSSNDDSGKQLDLLISDNLKLLMLRRVVIGNEIKQKCEKILFEIRFITKESWPSNIEISVDERIEFVLNRIDELVLIGEVNSLFLLAARATADNLFVLKDKVKQPLDQLPWGHMEFYISVFLFKFNAGYKLTLTFNINKLINYLILFKDGLINIKNNSLITAGCFDQFYKEFELNRSFLALTRIARYMKAIDTPCSDDVVMRLAIERCVQVTGENLKSSDMSPNISAEVETLFEVAAPNFLDSIRNMRDALSHVEYMENRLKIADEIYLKLKKELKSIYPKILDFIFMQQYYKFECFIDTEIISIKKIVLNSAPYLDDYLNSELLKACLIDDDTTGSNEKLLHCFCKNIKAKDRLDLLQLLLNVIDNIHNVDSIEEFFILSTPETRNYLNDFYKILTNKNEINLDNYRKMLNKQPEVHLETNKIQEDIKKIIMKICTSNDLDYEIFNECLQFGDLFKSLIKSINKNSIDAKDLFESIKNQTKIELFHNNLPSNRKELRVFTNQLKNLDYEDTSSKIIKLYLKENDKNKNDKIVKLFNTLFQTIYNIDISNSVKSAVKIWLKLNTEHLIQNVCNSLKHLLAHNSNDELHRAALEMCNLDILELYKDYQLSNNNAPFYESYPILLGKVFRNHLAHYNVSFDQFPNDHSLLLTANKLTDPNFSKFLENNNSKIGTINPITFEELVNNYKQSKLVILNQSKLFETAQNGTLANFQECLRLNDIASNLNNKNVTIYVTIGDNLDVFKYLLQTTKLNLDLKKIAIQHNSINILKLLLNLDGIQGDELHYAVLYNQINIAQTLLELVNSKSFSNNLTPLHLACLLGRIEMATLLIQNGADIEARDSKYNAPIHLAAIMGNLDIINLLLLNKAETNSLGCNKKTAMHFAAGNGHENLITALLPKSTNINSQDIRNQTALHLAAQSGHTKIASLLLQNGAKIDLKDADGNTPTHLATIHKNYHTFQLLITPQTTLQSNYNGDTILHLINDYEMALLLPIEILVNCKNKLNRTPLHSAVINNNLKIVKLLIDKGANLYVIDNLLYRPINYAKHNPSILKYLQKFNVDETDVESILRNLSNKYLDNLQLNFENIIDSLQYNYFTNIENILMKINVFIEPLNINDKMFHAAFNGDCKKIKELLKLGADLHAKIENEFNLLDVAAFNGHLNVLESAWIEQLPVSSALHISALNNHVDGIRLLLDMDVDVNTVDELQFTALHNASVKGHFESMKILIQYGADINSLTKSKDSALHLACETGNLESINLLIENGAKCNITNQNQITPLHIAAYNGHNTAIQLLLEKGADINATKEGQQTALHCTAGKGHHTTIELLIKSGSNINQLDGKNNSALHFACMKGCSKTVNLLLNSGADVSAGIDLKPIHVASHEGFDEIIKILLNHGSSVNVFSKNCPSPLYIAVKYGHLTTVEMLLDHKADANASIANELTPLHAAVETNQFDLINLLVRNGADVNYKIGDGNTVLHYAIEQGSYESIKLIIELGADVNAFSKNNVTPLRIAIETNQIKLINLLISNGADINFKVNNKSYLHYAIQFGAHDSIKLLLNMGIEISEMGFAPIHLATIMNDLETVNLLLDKGADVNAIVSMDDTISIKGFNELILNQCTPLHFACVNGNPNLVNCLLNRGANGTVGNIIKPLHISASKGQNEITKILLSKGISVNILDENNATPLHYAITSNHQSTIQLLLNNQADINASTKTKLSPLHKASAVNQPALINLLITNGADINQTDINGNTNLHIAAQYNANESIKSLLINGAEINSINNSGSTALHEAAFYSNLTIVRLLLQNGADVNAVNLNQFTPLHLADLNDTIQLHCNLSKNCNDSNSLIELLIKYGDDLNVLDKNSTELIELLIEYGVNVNALDMNSSTVLHYATKRGRVDCVEVLVRSGADVNLIDCDHRSAIDVVNNILQKIQQLMVKEDDGVCQRAIYLLKRFEKISKYLLKKL